MISNKKFWQTIKPLVSNKNGFSNSNIMLIEEDKLITDEKKLVECFNEHYINIVEKLSGLKPDPINYSSENNKVNIVKDIIIKFKNHPSIIKIKEKEKDSEDGINCGKTFNFCKINENDISKLFNDLKTDVSTGEDKIPAKLTKLAKPYLIEPLTKAINSSISTNTFPLKAKRATVTPLDKGGINKTDMLNYRPVSVLNIFSKFYERVIKDQITNFMNSKMSTFLSAYRKNYSTQNVLTRLIEEWKKKLDKNYVVGSILMDLSKAFDCVPHDLIIAKLAAYGFEIDALQYILSYLTEREQATRINGIYSLFQTLL